ncbi:hypothetical protein [Saccharopolyspora griseoalba]|uniref:Uncharacterized protein n=1 Tax=Saccharopolyspora griseoalba TaxID=1431848 RepID=A0ABW2LSI9_9PSEU
MASNETWRPVVNALAHTVQFQKTLDEDYAAHVAQSLIVRPLVEHTAEQQYAALARAAETGTDLTQLVADAHTEADFRTFMSAVVAQMDALRPWPEPPFERVPLERWEDFPSPEVIGRVKRLPMKVQTALQVSLRKLQDTEQLCVTLRLKSGALVALVAQWWPDSHDSAVITQAGQHDPDRILRELRDITRFSEDKIIKTSS